MAWRNIWRNPRRTLLTICAIAFASLLMVFMLSFQFGSYDTMLNSSAKIYTGHLQIQATQYHETQKIHRVVDRPQQVGHLLDHTDGIEAYAYRGQAFALISSDQQTYGSLVTGVEPRAETAVSRIHLLMRKGSYLSAEDVDTAIVGRLLARNLRVAPGDELTLLGQGRDGSVAATVVIVKGIFSSGIDDFDRSTLYIPLRLFQDTFSMREAVHQVVVTGRSLADIPKIKSAILRQLVQLKTPFPLIALDWQDLMPGLQQSIKMDLVSGAIFYFILVLVVAFSILNTFLMAILERTDADIHLDRPFGGAGDYLFGRAVPYAQDQTVKTGGSIKPPLAI
jgi:ABC-type lipoprotein release transport system permease subunit